MNTKSFEEVLDRFSKIEFNESFDIIVAVANGGLVPAGILKQRLGGEVELLKINFRDDCQSPRYDAPLLLAPIEFDCKGKSILIVDDRIKTGATIKLAKELMKDAKLIKTFAVNGQADYALYNESCFRFPWIMNN